MGFFITYILSTVGIVIAPLTEVAIVVAFAVLVGFIAFRGINGSTKTNLMINIAQIGMLIGVTGVALAYRFINPDHVSFYYTNPASRRYTQQRKSHAIPGNHRHTGPRRLRIRNCVNC